MTKPPVRRIPVLIVGGGPIGLALAADLGRRGINVTLIEQREDRLGSAKMIVVSVRTMEFCRHLGIAPQVRNWGFPLEHCLDSVFVTTLGGYELGRVRTPSLAEEADSPFSPERERPCPQTWFDPIVQAEARRHPHVRLRYQVKLESFTQDPEGVTAELVDLATGDRETARADYLVGCDGYSSTVRELLGIEVRGNKQLDLSMSVYVRIKNLRRHHDKGDAYRYVFVGPEGVWSVLTTMDGKDLWRLQLIGSDEIDVRKHDLDQAIRRCIGNEAIYTIEDVSIWVRKMTVADRFLDGRALIAGDSAHAHPPNGGLGMNTGIQDSWDLGWKLAATLQGWGGPTLLESYDYERRPACNRAAAESLRNYRRLTDQPRYPHLEAATNDGERQRQELGHRLVEQNERAWHPIGVHLGYVYNPSPIVVDDGTPRAEDDTIGYVPSTRPGARAPHVWLDRERSIIDMFGKGFVLLKFAAIDTKLLEHAARDRGVPLRVETITNVEAAALYERTLVLVRPDGHVAWRGNATPMNVANVIDIVRGAGPRIAARKARIEEACEHV